MYCVQIQTNSVYISDVFPSCLTVGVLFCELSKSKVLQVSNTAATEL